jgi:cellulose synthase operon protein C
MKLADMSRPFAATVLAVLASTAAIAAADHAASQIELRKGIAALNANDLREANVHLLNAVKADEGDALTRAVFGRVQLALGYGENGRRALDRALALGIAPSRINHLLGEAALMQGDIPGALKFLDAAGIDPKYAAYGVRIRARALMMAGDFAGAGRTYEAALQMTPKNAQLWVDIGRYRVNTGNLAGAIFAARNATKFNPNSVEANLLMGEMMRSQYGLVASIPWFEKVLEIDPLNVSAMSDLAATYGDSGQNRAMLAMARRLLVIDKANPMAYFYEAVLAARANKPELARSIIYRIGDRLNGLPAMQLLQGILAFQSGSNEQAIKLLGPLVDMQPGNDQARRLLGAAHFKAEDFKSAVAVLLPLARRSDADSYALAIVGRSLEALGVREDAMKFLDRAGTSTPAAPTPFDLPIPRNGGDPNDANVAIPEIARLIANGRAGDALARSRFIQTQNPGVPAAYVLIGDSLNALGRPAEAVDAYRQAANIRFNEGTALRLVRALVSANKNGEALRVLDLLLTQNPRSAAGRMLAADVFLANRDWTRAIAVLEGLRLQLGNREAVVLNGLAWAYLNTKQPDKALGFSRAAYELMPSNPMMANMYGWALIETGKDNAKGVGLLEKALAIDPLNYGYRLQLAQAYAKTGNKSKARAAAQWLLAKPDFEDKPTAAALLKRL